MQIPTDWTFKREDIAAGFDAHVREQLPWYELATNLTAHIARNFLPQDGVLYDIGASTGNIGRALRDVLFRRNIDFHPIDDSQAMKTHYSGPGKLEIADAAGYDYKPFDVAICFLSLMFIPVAQRKGLIANLRAARKLGGAIIVIDKMIPPEGYLATVMSRMTMASKAATSEDIISKELSLSGIQRPLSLREISPAVEVFRFGDFAGWVIDDECESANK